MTDKFKVADLAVAKRKKTPRTTKNGPVVTVAKAYPAAINMALELTRDRDVHIEVQRDGSLIIKNGGRK
jgi:hypothetical protein